MTNKTVIKTLRVDPTFAGEIDAELERRNLTFSEAVRRALRLFFDCDAYSSMHRANAKRNPSVTNPASGG